MKNATVVLFATINGICLYLAAVSSQHGKMSFKFFIGLLAFSIMAWGIYSAKKFFHFQNTTIRAVLLLLGIYFLATFQYFLPSSLFKDAFFGLGLTIAAWILLVSFLDKTLPNRKILFLAILPSAILLLWPIAQAVRILILMHTP
jgi:hypothetical protein